MDGKAVFFDRDGTLNIDTGYISRPENMSLFPGARETIDALRNRGYLIFIISNQSGIGRGILPPADYRLVNEKFLALMGDDTVDEIVYCPHSPERACNCRKPMTLLIEIIAERYRCAAGASFFVGDKLSDIECGRASGMKTIFITHEGNVPSFDPVRPDFQVPSIKDVIGIIP